MKLCLKIFKKRSVFEISNESTITELYQSVRKVLGSENIDFYLSLNGSDPLTAESEGQTLSGMGLVNGDTIWVVGLDGEGSGAEFFQTFEEKNAKCSSDSKNADNSIVLSSSATEGEESSSCKGEIENTLKHFEKFLLELNPETTEEKFICLVHFQMVERGFFSAEARNKIKPENWKAKLGEDEFVKIFYRHKDSDTNIQLRFHVDKDRMDVHGVCDCGDSRNVTETLCFLKSKASCFNNIKELWKGYMWKNVECRIVGPLSIFSLGYGDAIFRVMQGLPHVRQAFLRPLDVRSCLQFEQICKAARRFTFSNSLWHHYLARDFPSIKDRLIREAEKNGRTMRQQYMRAVEEKKKTVSQRLILLEEPSEAPLHEARKPFPPSFPYQPEPTWPGISGDPSDIFPDMNSPYGTVYPRRPGINPYSPFAGGNIPGGPPSHRPRYRPPGRYPNPDFHPKYL